MAASNIEQGATINDGNSHKALIVTWQFNMGTSQVRNVSLAIKMIPT
jgi:hypothetical protein